MKWRSKSAMASVAILALQCPPVLAQDKPYEGVTLTIASQNDQFAAVMGATSGIRRAGAAALDLADVAAGRLDCFWELSLAPWDVAAGVLLVREAGGVVTTVDGSPDVVRHGSIVAGNPTLHHWLMDLLRST